MHEVKSHPIGASQELLQLLLVPDNREILDPLDPFPCGSSPFPTNDIAQQLALCCEEMRFVASEGKPAEDRKDQQR